MRAAAFFDLDGTLLQGESQFSFLIWCARRRIVPPVRSLSVAIQYVSYLLGFSRDALRLRESGFNLLRGIAVERLEKAGVEFFHSCLTSHFRKQALPLIETHRSRGDVIVLLTSACELVASPVAEWMRADAVIATNLVKDGGIVTTLNPKTGEILKQGRLTGALETYYSSPVGGAGKVFMASQKGKVTVLKAGAQWEFESGSDFAEESFATPAIVDGTLYLRTRTKLYAFGGGRRK